MTAQFQFFQSLPHKKADFVKKKPIELGVTIWLKEKRQIEGSWYLARASFSSILPTWMFHCLVYSRWVTCKKTIKRFSTSHNNLVIASDNHETRSLKTMQRFSTSHIDLLIACDKHQTTSLFLATIWLPEIIFLWQQSNCNRSCKIIIHTR